MLWLTHKTIMTSERNQTQNITYFMIPFILNAHKKQTYITELDDWLPWPEDGNKE